MTNKADKLMKTLLNTIVIILDRWMMPGLLDQLYDDDLTPYNKRVAANIKKSLKGTKRSMEPGKNAQWLKIYLMTFNLEWIDSRHKIGISRS